MPDVSPSEIDRHNQQVLEELCRLLRFSQGEFELVLAVCNSTQQRQGLVQQLRQQCSVSFAEITLDPSTTTLFTTIRSQIGSPFPEALMVYGLDGVQDQRQLLVATNQIREEFRQFPFPLVLWLTDDGLKQLIRTAPDFYTWANSVTFATPPEFFLAFLDQLIADVGRQVVESRENRFLSNQELGLTPGSARCRELEASLEVLTAQGIALTPEQLAGLAFVQGRIADHNTPAAREHYDRSLAQWQALIDQNPSVATVAQWQENVGHVQFYLGLWWLNYSVRHRREFEPACQQACRYFEQGVQTFEEAQRPELAARYINYWAEALHRLESWDALETVAAKARLLHQAQGNPIRQARTEGFLAEVDLAHENYGAAQRHAEAALALIQPFADSHAETSAEDRDFYAWVNSFHRSWYVFSLGKAQMGQGQVDAAVQTLEQVPTITQPEYDPQLYSQTLEYLRRGYFEQGHYLQAFETRREKEAIESRFNFRAFVGAGRLQPKQQITNPALPTGDHGPDLIMASGRRQDVSRLVTRLEQDEFVLTVVYGPSGVGKSSLIEAGLVPTLEQQRFGGRQVVPVRLRSYGNWIEEVMGAMPRPAALANSAGEKAADLETRLLDLLRQQTQVNRVIVLIFDQFEEFFFACEQPVERLRFYRFLGDCLAMPFIKVVLSLREDYTHYLLECNRLTDLAIIDNNILDKKWIYYLGNFSPEDARGVIDDLTQPTPYAPTPDLVERVVTDLAAEAGEVRPIELQIVGSQLQAEGIATLADYQGWPHPGVSIKAALVQQYLNDVVRDCGPVAQQQLANLVLYLLTDERGTRPLKTQTELLNDLHTFTNHTELDAKAFGLVLQVLTQSGLVVRVPNAPDDRYQLVHDYLAAFLRSSQQPLMAQLAQERQMRMVAEQQRFEEQRKRIEAERQKLRQTRLAAIGLCSLAAISTGIGAFALVQQQKALTGINAQTLADSLAMENYLEAGFEEAAVTQAMLTRQALQDNRATHLEPHNRFRAISSIRKVMYGVKERERLIGHSAGVNSVVFSPDGETIATASGDQSVKLWNRQGKELQTLKGHSAGVLSVAFSPDGETIATASGDQSVKLWNRQGKELQTLKGHSAGVLSVAFSPDGETIATASGDQSVKLWNRQGKELQTLKGHSSWVSSVVFSPDGETIATASGDQSVKLWSRQGEELQTLKGHSDAVWSVAFSPDGETVATASEDRSVKLWNRQGKELQTLKGHSDIVHSVVFSPDGETIATASADQSVKLWSRQGEELQTLKGHSDAVWSVAFSPDGETIATASGDQSVKLWSRQGEELQTLKGHSDTVWALAFSPDGETIATASGDQSVKLWSRQGEELQTLKGHSDTVWSVAFSPDGETIATASLDQSVKLWSRQGEELQTLKGHSAGVLSVAFSPDGETIATASEDQSVKLWNFQLADLTAKGCNWLDTYFTKQSPELLIKLSICQERDPSLRMAAAPMLVTQGEKLARDGNVKLARKLFQQAIAWDSSLDIDPKTKAQNLAQAQTLVDEAKELAQTGKISEATAKLATAKSLDPSLEFEPETHAKKLAVQGYLAKGKQLVNDGNVAAAVAAYRQADALNLKESISAFDWSELCWVGSTYNQAEAVMFACEKAMTLNSENGDIIVSVSRGLARALTGDTQGAIADFQAFPEWTVDEEAKAQLQGWINALEKGENPFTPEVLKTLR
ncbi:hypothetical protein [Leptolyngbya sp. GB2-A2]|uniref:nSTAND1 domain-containing NTPase n=1 Tax=Leptolyngbya sp. GB2-A2 TaxID=2933915 RepID=UPI0032994C3F